MAFPKEGSYELKMCLINIYAEEIFERIAEKHFPTTINEVAVYLPYRKLLEQIQGFLSGRGT